jgi:hypothetical protein
MGSTHGHRSVALTAVASSIIRKGDTYHGISADGRGVFTHENVHNRRVQDRRIYAGQCKDGYACGLGTTTTSQTWCDGSRTEWAEYGPDGQYDGRCLCYDVGQTTYYYGSPRVSECTYYDLYERGEVKESAVVGENGTCSYNGKNCARNDPRLLALIAQVGPVKVRPAAPAHHLQSPPTRTPSNRPMDQPARFAPAGARADHCHRGAPLRRTPSLVTVRHNPRPAALQSTTTQ